MTQKLLFADSTVGVTIYNVLAMNSAPLTLDQLHSISMRMQHINLEMEQVVRCVDKLVELKRIVLTDGVYSLQAHERLFVVKRDMRDFDPDTMEGGWGGWLVKDPRIRDGIGTRPLEHILGVHPVAQNSEVST